MNTLRALAFVALATVVTSLGMSPAPGRAASASAVAYAPPGQQVVRAASLTQVADRAARSVVDDPDREVQSAFTLADQHVVTGDVSIVAQPAQVNQTYVSIPVSIVVDGKAQRTVYAGYRIVQYVHTVVAAHDLSSGTVLGPGDLTIGRVQWYGRSAVDVGSLVGRQMNISVSRGTALYFEQTRINELVRAGQPCMFVIHDGSVMLAADVIARTGGGLGELVAIYNPVTHKALSGVVTGPGKVELTLPGGEIK